MLSFIEPQAHLIGEALGISIIRLKKLRILNENINTRKRTDSVDEVERMELFLPFVFLLYVLQKLGARLRVIMKKHFGLQCFFPIALLSQMVL